MTNNKEKFYRTLTTLCSDPRITKLKAYSQHKGIPTFQHCRNVAVYSFYLAEKLGWRIDEDALARGAMLHDYYLYTVVEKQKETKLSNFKHGITHPQLSLENALKEFDLTEKEKNIIRAHMWPLTIFHIPMSKEAWLVCLTDTYCAIRELSGDTKELEPGVRTNWVLNFARRKLHESFA